MVTFNQDCCDGSDELPNLCKNSCSDFFKNQLHNSMTSFQAWQRGLKKKIENVIDFYSLLQEYKTNENSVKELVKETDEKIEALEALTEVLEDNKDDIEKTISDLKDSKNSLENYLKNVEKIDKLDLGKYKEFGSLLNVTIEKEINKYKYYVGFFDRAYQKEGGSQYSLG